MRRRNPMTGIPSSDDAEADGLESRVRSRWIQSRVPVVDREVWINALERHCEHGLCRRAVVAKGSARELHGRRVNPEGTPGRRVTLVGEGEWPTRPHAVLERLERPALILVSVDLDGAGWRLQPHNAAIILHDTAQRLADARLEADVHL